MTSREYAEDDGPTYEDDDEFRSRDEIESEAYARFVIGAAQEASGVNIEEEPKPWPHNEPRVRSYRRVSARQTIEEITINIDNPPSEQALEILSKHLPEWIREFMSKNADYGDTSHHLGAAGQYAELWRKVGKLKGPLWDGKELNHEQADEIVRDLIGHCFLTLLFLEEDNIR